MFLKNIFAQLFSKTASDLSKDQMKKFLIVGLGNIGKEYANTRHNIGFFILDNIAKQYDFTFKSEKLGSISKAKIKGRNFVFLKPSTYMNLSGKAVNYWLQKEKIPLENLLIICDDLNLPFGAIRLKSKGSDGGHNGLKDIQNVLGTTKYARFRFGVGANFSKGKQCDFVLGEWSTEEEKLLPERLEKSASLVVSFGFAGINNTMNTFNGK
ncbi:MAG: aminoacyl-tRNA hydrolase [Lutibacter sp.]